MTSRSEVQPWRPYVLPVGDLKLAAKWVVGPATLEPPGALLREVKRAPAGRSRVKARRWLHGIAVREAEQIRHQVTIALPASDQDDAAAKASEIMRVLRLYQRVRYPHVELRHQAFGLPGEVYEVSRTAIVLGHDPSVAWRRLGNLAGWEFSPNDCAQLDLDPRFSYLLQASAVLPAERNRLQQRAFLALELIDAAWVSEDPRVQVLFLAIGAEALLGLSGKAGETLRLARRAAYLTCPARCGRDSVPVCRYLEPFRNRPAIHEYIRSRQEVTEHGLCSAFLDISHGLFPARDSVAHKGATPESDESDRHHGVVEGLYMAALAWFAIHPEDDIDDLEQEIQHLTPAKATRRLSASRPPPA